VTNVAVIFYLSVLNMNRYQSVGERQLMVFLKIAYGIGNKTLTCDSKAMCH